MGLLDFDIMKLLVPDRVEKEPDKYCPVCNCGNIEHGTRICSNCRIEEINDEEPIEHQSINDPSGFLHQ
jgi:hypothetical protein